MNFNFLYFIFNCCLTQFCYSVLDYDHHINIIMVGIIYEIVVSKK